MRLNSKKNCQYAWRLTAIISLLVFQTWASIAEAAFSQCAVENAFCSFTGTRNVRYGSDTRWTYKTLTGGTNCTNGVFGDPAVGTPKICELETVTALPDLVVVSLSQSPLNPAVGQLVTFSAVVKNIGTVTIPSGTTIGMSFSIDGVNVNWAATSTVALAPGASLTLTSKGGTNGATWKATTGSHTLMGHIDDVNRIQEANESNNQLGKNFLIGTSTTTTLTRTTTTTSTTTTTTLPPQSGALTTIDQVISAMSTPSEIIPLFPVYEWQRRPMVISQSPSGADIPSWFSGSKPAWLYDINSWFQVFEAEGNAATNTRVQVKNIRLYTLSQSTRKWTRIDIRPTPNVHLYKYPYAYVGAPNARTESTGGLSVKPVYPNFHHGYGFQIGMPSPSDVRAVFTIMEFRLVTDNSNVADDRSRAKYALSVGGDFWPGNGAGQADWSYSPGIGQGRMLLATPSWKSATMLVPNGRYGATLSEMKSNPPPLALP